MTTHRFIGHCHGCRRDDREVETRYDRGARTLCDRCYRTTTTTTPATPGGANFTTPTPTPSTTHRKPDRTPSRAKAKNVAGPTSEQFCRKCSTRCTDCSPRCTEDPGATEERAVELGRDPGAVASAIGMGGVHDRCPLPGHDGAARVAPDADGALRLFCDCGDDAGWWSLADVHEAVDRAGPPRKLGRGERHLWTLLLAHRAGLLPPADVRLGELPRRASPAMRAVAADMRLLLGLRRAVGDGRPMLYPCGLAKRRCGLVDKSHASRTIRALERAGVIANAGALGAIGARDGAKLYAEPTARTVPDAAGGVEVPGGVGRELVGVQPAHEAHEHVLMSDAVVEEPRCGGFGAVGGGAVRDVGGGVWHGSSGVGCDDDTPAPGGGPCPDPDRCRHWRRHASGPWTCAHNHPAADDPHDGDPGDPDVALVVALIAAFDATEVTAAPHAA